MAKKKTPSAAEKKSQAARQAVKEAKAQLDRLDQLVNEVAKRLKAERQGVLPSREALLAATAEARGKANRSKAEISRAKIQIKKRKKEIDEWKLWYNGIPKIDKTLEMAKLTAEIQWRAAEIGKLERKIASLYEKHLAATIRMETASQQLAACDANVFDLPVEQDPRLHTVNAALNAAKAAHENAKAALKRPKQKSKKAKKSNRRVRSRRS